MKKKNLSFLKRVAYMKTLLLICFFSLSIASAFAQNKTITGIVTDVQKDPLPGVSVAIKGTTVGTVTDLDGKYSINAKSGDLLVFTYLGMKTQSITVSSANTINVILEDDSQVLTETVVIGYGSAKKADLTGAIGSVSSEQITKQPSMNAIQSVQGKVAGVNITASDAPGSNPTISIRGLGTALGGREPLYIVDGFPVDNISTISPSDIVSMNILKDASSASIYGLRAANGVVMITTKKGQSGAPKISVDSYVGIKSAMNKVKMANASEYITYFNENQAMLKKYGSTTAYSLADASKQPFNTDWYDELLNTGFFNNNTVSISGGGQAVDYFLSYNFYDEKGVLENQTYQRSTIRNNNVYKFYNDRLKFTQNLNISFSNDNPKPFGSFNNAYRQSPLVPVRYSNGLAGLPYANKETGVMWAERGDESNGKLNSIGNPVYGVNSHNERTQTFTLQGGIEGEFKLTDFLKINSRFGATKYYYKNRVFTNIRQNWLNSGSVDRTDAGFDAEYNKAPQSPAFANNSLALKNLNTFRWTWEGFVTFNKTFSGHSIDAVAGLSREKFNIGDEENLTGYNVPSKSQYWSMNHASSNYLKEVKQFDYTRTALASYFARVQYNYNHKYYASATIRRDGSSNFKTGGKYWGTFPSFGLGWTITEEEFMKGFTALNYLKLRGTWGKLGNQNIPFNYTTYHSIPGSDQGNFVFGDEYEQGATLGTPAKPLSWEVTRETGIGFDFNMLDSRLSGSFDYYDKLNTNAILKITPIPTSQYSSDYYDHVGKISNRGIELNLGWSDKLPMGLTYDINVNYSYNKNKVKDIAVMYEGRTGGSLSDGQLTKRLKNGQSVFAWWMYEADGVWQSQEEIDQARANGDAILGSPRPGYLKYKDQNGDGKIDDNDKVYSGSYLPTSNYGIHIGLGYKAIDFSIDGYGVAGNKIYNGLKYGRIDGGENISQETFKDRWTGEGSTNKNPGASREAIASTYYLESGNFFRINNITLGYTFKDLVFKGSSLRAYITAQNPFMFTKYKGFTPEIIGKENGDPVQTAGIELDAYPSTRNFLFGINLQF
jgi:TonB-linked SusC/RagA family outer membrane protein